MTIPYELLLEANAKVTKETKKRRLSEREQKARSIKQRLDQLKLKRELMEIENEHS